MFLDSILMLQNMKTYMAKASDIQRKWYIIDAEGLINYEYENNYMLISFSQKNADSGAFLVRNGRTWDEIENQKVEDKELLEFIQGNSAGQVIENVYSIQVEPGTPLIIYPQLSADAWTCEMGAMVMGDNDPNLEPAMDESGNHYLGYVVPKAAKDNIYIFIKDWTEIYDKNRASD